jgi:hydrogenase nickel incorporation protein HypB
MDLQQLDLLFIENVGSLVCPAAYDLGEHLRVVVMSTTEGEDKPLKYPGMFRRAHGLVISKMDLLPFICYDLQLSREYALKVNMELRIFETSAITGRGIRKWTEWLLYRFRRSPVCWEHVSGDSFLAPGGGRHV